MSNMADTSIAALAHVDRTAGQRRVLAVFEKWTNITRHEIAEKSGLPLQSVCGRVNELLKSGALFELEQTRDGRHLLKLNNDGRPAGCEADQAMRGCAGDRVGANTPPVACKDSSAGNAAPPVTHADPQGGHPTEGAVAVPCGSGASAPRWVTPVIQGKRLTTMSREIAKQIMQDKGNAFYDEAQETLRVGKHWRDV